MRLSAIFRLLSMISIVLPTLLSEATAEDEWKKIQAEINRIELRINESEFPGMSHWRKNAWQGEFFYYGNSSSNMGYQNILKIWYYELASRYYPDPLDLSGSLSDWKMFKTRSNLVTLSGQLDSGEVSSFSYIIFMSDNTPCALISSTWGMEAHMGTQEGNERLNLVLCKKVGEIINATELDNLVASVGIRDVFPPQNAMFSIGDQDPSQVGAKSQKSESKFIAKENIDKEYQLKEARDLFEKGLITEGQYEKMVNKILGIQ